MVGEAFGERVHCCWFCQRFTERRELLFDHGAVGVDEDSGRAQVVRQDAPAAGAVDFADLLAAEVDDVALPGHLAADGDGDVPVDGLAVTGGSDQIGGADRRGHQLAAAGRDRRPRVAVLLHDQGGGIDG